jgi:hypothetical protein
MRRRIERSRARCEKAAAKQQSPRDREAEKLSKLTATDSLEGDEKGG